MEAVTPSVGAEQVALVGVLGDATLAAAILDRLVMRAVRIDIDGPSYRQHLARQRAKKCGGSPPDGLDQEPAAPEAP